MGSSHFITNLEFEIAEHIEYVPFGEVFIEEGNGSFATPYLYNGKELDPETGYYYYGARYYNPRVSQWLSVDPLVEKTLQPYSYANNNPINLIDLDGREGTDWVRGKDRRIYWDNNATSQRTTKAGETYIGRTDKSVLDYLGLNASYVFSEWSLGASSNIVNRNVATDWSIIDFRGRSNVYISKIKVGNELRVGFIGVDVFARAESSNPNINLRVGGEVNITIGDKTYSKTLLPTKNSVPEGIETTFTFNPRFLDSSQKKSMDVSIIPSASKDNQWAPPVYHPFFPIPVKARFKNLDLNKPSQK